MTWKKKARVLSHQQKIMETNAPAACASSASPARRPRSRCPTTAGCTPASRRCCPSIAIGLHHDGSSLPAERRRVLPAHQGRLDDRPRHLRRRLRDGLAVDAREGRRHRRGAARRRGDGEDAHASRRDDRARAGERRRSRDRGRPARRLRGARRRVRRVPAVHGADRAADAATIASDAELH